MTLSQKIAEIIMDKRCRSGSSKEITAQILSLIRESLPKEKVRPLESFADKKIGEEYMFWKDGYNLALKDVKKIFSI